MEVSLVIPSYKREELLVNCLRCAFKQKDVDYEVIVIDQTKEHQEDTRAFIEQHQSNMRYIYSDVASLTHARNRGLKEAQGEIIVFIDDDTEFEDSFLWQHLNAHRQGADIVQGRVMESNSTVSDQPAWLTPMVKFSGSDTCDRDGITNSITGCNFSVSKKVANKIGYFDTTFFGCSLREDSDFGYRAYKEGFNLRFCAKAAVFHHRSSSGGVEAGINNIYFDTSYYFCELYFGRKHFSKYAVLLLKIRLFLRGAKALRKMIKIAEHKVVEKEAQLLRSS